jgi:anti-anti-sigma regulatory factor
MNELLECAGAPRSGMRIALSIVARATKENRMLKISIVEGRKQRRLVVEGKLVAPWSDELQAACERARAGLNGRELVIDLKNVTTISQQGENLLLELMKRRVKCRGCGLFTNEILKQLGRRLHRNGAHE